MGTLSADISSDSPIAPLLQTILHLRLGDNERGELLPKSGAFQQAPP